MRRALMSVDGVVAAEVSYDDKRADVQYRPNLVAPDVLVKAVNDIGFEASVMDGQAAASGSTP